jgi:hypothetical protein
MYFTCLCYSIWLEIDDGFCKKIFAVFLLVHKRPSPELLVGVWTVHCFSMQCGTVWKREAQIDCEEKDLEGTNKI